MIQPVRKRVCLLVLVDVPIRLLKAVGSVPAEAVVYHFSDGGATWDVGCDLGWWNGKGVPWDPFLQMVGETGLEPVTSSLSYRIGFHRPRAAMAAMRCGLDYILTISGPPLVVSEASRKLQKL